MPLYTKTPKNDSNVREALMSINQFNKPVELVGPDAEAMLISRLILLEPGTIQTHPDMGVGIVSYYRHSTTVDLQQLRSRIANQVQTYLPMFTSVEVKTELDESKHQLYVYIATDQMNIMVPFDTQNLTITLGDMKK